MSSRRLRRTRFRKAVKAYHGRHRGRKIYARIKKYF